MKKNTIKTMAVSLALLNALTLSGCKKNDINNNKDNNNSSPILSNIFERKIDLYKSEYETVSNQEMITIKDAKLIVEINGNPEVISTLDKGTEVKAIKENGEYTQILLENGTIGFIKSNSLTLGKNIKNINFENVENNNAVILTGTPLYDEKGLFVGIVKENNTVKAIKTSDELTLIEYSEKQENYGNKTKFYALNSGIYYIANIHNKEYTSVFENNEYFTLNNTNLYNENGFVTHYLPYLQEFNVLATNGEYSLISLIDGTTGYIKNEDIAPVNNNLNLHAYLKAGTPMFEDPKLISQYSTLNENILIHVHYVNDEYALVGDDSIKYTYYVKRSDIELINNINYVYSYMYYNKDSMLYSDLDLTESVAGIDKYQLGYVVRMNNDIAEVMDVFSRRLTFVKTSDITLLDNTFIDIDLGDQRIDCYINGRLEGSWGTRSGKDSTPTHEGIFDIDWKANNWEFTDYPGCYAKNWIPYNEMGEGIHDLVGDDEANYGNSWYHNVGSHGCVRVPLEASTFVNNNYDLGQMVLVHK